MLSMVSIKGGGGTGFNGASAAEAIRAYLLFKL
jgi:hypothetical protein